MSNNFCDLENAYEERNLIIDPKSLHDEASGTGTKNLQNGKNRVLVGLAGLAVSLAVVSVASYSISGTHGDGVSSFSQQNFAPVTGTNKTRPLSYDFSSSYNKEDIASGNACVSAGAVVGSLFGGLVLGAGTLFGVLYACGYLSTDSTTPRHHCPYNDDSDDFPARAPVDYLYNMEDVKLTVELSEQGEFFLVKPEFSPNPQDYSKSSESAGTWNVEKAGPNGNLLLADRTNTPFLWWESSVKKESYQNIITPALIGNKKRFLVDRKSDSLTEFFKVSLDHIGFNKQEIDDFTQYWLNALGVSEHVSERFSLTAHDNKRLDSTRGASLTTGQPKKLTGTKLIVDIIVDDDLDNVYERGIAKTILQKNSQTPDHVATDFTKRVFFVFTAVTPVVRSMVEKGVIAVPGKGLSVGDNIPSVLGEKVHRPDEVNEKAKVFVEWGGAIDWNSEWVNKLLFAHTVKNQQDSMIAASRL